MNNSKALDYLAQGEKKFLSINSLSSDSNIFVTDNSNNNHRISTHNRDKKFENLEKSLKEKDLLKYRVILPKVPSFGTTIIKHLD
jgi:hypothetical protein